MNTVPIAFAFDNNLILPACICISSLMMNAQKTTFYDIFILHSSEEDLNKDMLNQIPTYYPNCRIQYRKVGKDFERAFEIRGITVAAYYRLLIPEIITEYDKILYSDVDVIFRKDLAEIFMTTEMENIYLAGVNSMSNHIQGYNDYYANCLHLDPSEIIYSGNLIINSKLIKEKGIISTFKELAKRNYTFQDMDIINIACKGHIKELPPFFCVTNYISERIVQHTINSENLWSEEEINDALNHGIVHYNGQKPWKGYCVNFDIWWEYYRKSPFFDQKYYFDFFNNKLNEFDKLSLWKRIKILIRWFVIGKK